MQLKNKEYLLSSVLFVGILVAFYSVYQDFVRFYGFEGTLFKIKDCIVPNPVITPCFWGAWAFLISLIWSLKNIKIKETEKRLKQTKYLLWFLMGGTMFAWTNFSLELIKFINAGGGEIVGCSGALVTNPFLTPCFYGSALFLTAMIVAFILKSKVKSQD
ncbi:hypothetical protein COV24_04595 [candidate division WWE3 bacterium CG10_big_fil_rev_8_21_14_0_10_32_10]|uniref:Vitamin K epoxide reductase domain-containing protein n=1 Tax=candidate division WWE3 bacterium CG10_big_fil_rev_8_21_14_0_10_32_10 TaxID=1975090 RepID=A0A2H0R973_UNCKA|nr:MAG: hypothetical protein COV24_04595 [candidate division WWE3 bacterium CG10_big_fil_rev_8_21_14_0_10_32_10]